MYFILQVYESKLELLDFKVQQFDKIQERNNFKLLDVLIKMLHQKVCTATNVPQLEIVSTVKEE